MSSKFYNKMPFPVKFRKIWLDGSPAIELPSGGMIEGPAEMLSQFSFLAPLPFDFYRVETSIQGPNFEYRDELINNRQEEPIHIITAKEEPEQIEEVVQEVTVVHTTEEEPTQVVEDTKEFDPKTTNWLTVKIAKLEAVAKLKGVDLSHTATMKPKERKWELVKLVKKAYGLI